LVPLNPEDYSGTARADDIQIAVNRPLAPRITWMWAVSEPG
jgi:hypothetical protein